MLKLRYKPLLAVKLINNIFKITKQYILGRTKNFKRKNAKKTNLKLP